MQDKMKYMLVLALAVAVTAIPLKKDDTPQLKKEKEETVQGRLQEFVSGDASSRTQLYQPILDILNAVQKNNKKVTGALEPVQNVMEKLAQGDHFRFLKDAGLRVITTIIDGNRDNFSYYKLDAVKEWADKRAQQVDGPEVETLRTISRQATDARDALDSMAQVFVKGVKAIKAETSKRDPDHDLVRQTAHGIVQIALTNKPLLIDNTQSAIETVQQRLRQ